jgi:hypothetical protein
MFSFVGGYFEGFPCQNQVKRSSKPKEKRPLPLRCCDGKYVSVLFDNFLLP